MASNSWHCLEAIPKLVVTRVGDQVIVQDLYGGPERAELRTFRWEVLL